MMAEQRQAIENLLYISVSNKSVSNRSPSLEVRKGATIREPVGTTGLDPEYDQSSGLIEVGGRLRQAELPLDGKHPIMLDPSHHIMKLLIQDYDEKLLHPGSERILAEIRHSGSVGRVIDTYPGTDGRVRAAKVRVWDQVYTRPVARLVRLPELTDEGIDDA